MKAIVYYENGSPDVLRYEDIEKPVAKHNEVLIQVHAASVNPLDCGSLNAVPYLIRIAFGMLKPDALHPGRPGVDVAGRVEAVGRDVMRFKPGDEVVGLCISDPRASGPKVWVHHQGAFAEYVCVPESILAMKADTVTFEQAASVPVAALTALQGLRDKGRIRAGQKVLINGAAGGVGTFAVQIAKAFGAQVTGVCSTRNVDLVRSLGADQVIDYTKENFTQGEQRYDLVIDCVGNHSLAECRRVLSPRGTCVLVGDLSGRGAMGILGRLIGAPVISRCGSRKLVLFLARPSLDDLEVLRGFMQAGKVKPAIDRVYPLSEAREAFRYLAAKHARGKVVIRLVAKKPFRPPQDEA